MSRTCGTQMNQEIQTKFWLDNLKGDHFGYLHIARRIILKLALEK